MTRRSINSIATSCKRDGTHLGLVPESDGADQGVVDARLNVYGVSNLKVADMSISPLNVGTNTYSTALLIGERAAMIIAEDLGIDCMDLTRARLK
ncbi:hypothetical protein DFJ58DRAFT_887330 [Suillus subalutaceus]|uniref:uncharacterized protein n=1 Tax=Suillus subalutaceus TaxID=48586 RepID=UPI001B86196C|nr:uncharacterized protein DFJ58DRAFT_887330 [Suillus subalutaceus]KAG1819467.1 hypothetical protein DFJ58DRAFT_887330 [Suillus subalutaceus]